MTEECKGGVKIEEKDCTLNDTSFCFEKVDDHFEGMFYLWTSFY